MRWYRANGRHSLPWRLTRDPYAVVVSEVMLQQTQVERVLPYYEAWMGRWPTVAALAAATPAEVIRAWAGLGYNRRALNLHRLASRVASDGWPVAPTESSLLPLPGVGPYTAAALLSFAYEVPAIVIDTNIARVVARVCLGAATQKGISSRDLRDAAAGLLPRSRVRDHNLALMDLGAQMCTARAPHCDGCPLHQLCAWRIAGNPNTAKGRRPTLRFEDTARYARGRIVDALRDGARDEQALADVLTPVHRDRLRTYLEGLERDGLAVRCDGTAMWSLPLTAG